LPVSHPSEPVDPETGAAASIAVLDIDGTLVDSVYQHTVAWSRAFRQVGLDVATYRLHESIGLAADRLISRVAGDQAERALGEEIRGLHAQELDHLWSSVGLLPGADRLIEVLKQAGMLVVCATSASSSDAQRALDLVPGSWNLDALVTGDGDVESKPAPDLLDEAIARAGGRPGEMRGLALGDSPWDMAAGRRAGLVPGGVRTGGFGGPVLRDAGAEVVLESTAEVVERMLHGGVDQLLT